MGASIPLRRFLVLIILFSIIMIEFPAEGTASSYTPEIQTEAPITSVSFTWYKFLLVGNNVNFTAKVFGGTAPFTFAWDFGDGQTTTASTTSVLHTYAAPGNLTVTLVATDSTPSTRSYSTSVTVLSWPTSWKGWTIRHNITANDGVNLWNVSYNGRLVIRDARMAGLLVKYKDGYCIFYDEFDTSYTDVGIFEYSSSLTDSYLQIRTTSIDRPFSLVGGYWYQQAWRFYASGRWDAEVWVENGGGCGADHYYETRWRFDLALGNGSGEFMRSYSPSGLWRPLLWEGDYRDNGFRDTAHNGTQWRFEGSGASYYIAPKVSGVPPNRDLPTITSKIYLVKNKPNEVELSPGTLFNIEDPTVWINPGELAFNRELAFWFLAGTWVHAPLVHTLVATANTITVSFYPYGL